MNTGQILQQTIDRLAAILRWAAEVVLLAIFLTFVDLIGPFLPSRYPCSVFPRPKSSYIEGAFNLAMATKGASVLHYFCCVFFISIIFHFYLEKSR